MDAKNRLINTDTLAGDGPPNGVQDDRAQFNVQSGHVYVKFMYLAKRWHAAPMTAPPQHDRRDAGGQSIRDLTRNLPAMWAR